LPAFSSIGLSTRAPIPADETFNLGELACNIFAAVGLRQIFPIQTIRIFLKITQPHKK
jgi:hypothetical protein